jgi:hypothetical protein
MATRVRLVAAGVAEVHREANRYAGELAEDIASDMRRYVPVLTGDLRSTIRVVHGDPVTRIWFGDVAAGIDYHLHQEYGTSVMEAQPYARPAVYQVRG